VGEVRRRFDAPERSELMKDDFLFSESSQSKRNKAMSFFLFLSSKRTRLQNFVAQKTIFCFLSPKVIENEAN
jgi:hypothetical protein